MQADEGGWAPQWSTTVQGSPPNNGSVPLQGSLKHTENQPIYTLFFLLFPWHTFCADVTATGTDVCLASGKAEETQATSEAPPLLSGPPGTQAMSHVGPVQGYGPGRLQGMGVMTVGEKNQRRWHGRGS